LHLHSAKNRLGQSNVQCAEPNSLTTDHNPLRENGDFNKCTKQQMHSKKKTKGPSKRRNNAYRRLDEEKLKNTTEKKKDKERKTKQKGVRVLYEC